MVRLEVIKTELLENRIEFTIEESNVHALTAGQRMLVDSDELAFIYILESKDEYVYVSIREAFWSQLKEALEKDKQVFIKINEKEEIEAVAFKAELEYLLSNIEDNSNYGEKMTSAVAAVFQEDKKV